MPLVDEAKRHDLYVAIEDLIGPERAETFMNMMPPTTWDDIATKADLSALELKLEARLHKELQALTRTFMLGLFTSTAATSSLCIGAIALAQ
ncbi:MAG TPA: hypothetical protein VEW93_04830 [Acidimicrobiales bacterium]|nr:hypothetical protein [Acidimicrobiales bacterium]